MDIAEVKRIEKMGDHFRHEIERLESELKGTKEALADNERLLKSLTFEIIGYDGKVHYRRQYGIDNNKLVLEALKTEGVTVRVLENNCPKCESHDVKLIHENKPEHRHFRCGECDHTFSADPDSKTKKMGKAEKLERAKKFTDIVESIEPPTDLDETQTVPEITLD